MSKRDLILNLPGFTIKKVTGYNPLILDVHYRRKARCVYCDHKKLRKKAGFMHQVRHELIGYRRICCVLKPISFIAITVSVTLISGFQG
jgi:transposase